MKKRVFNKLRSIKLLALICFCCNQAMGSSYSLQSPNGKVCLKVHVGDDIYWQVDHEDTPVILPSILSLTLSNGEIMGKYPRISKTSQQTVDSKFETPFYKKSYVTDRYAQLLLKFRDGYSLEFRAYDDGAAYRFLIDRKGELCIAEEQAVFTFADDYKAFVPYINDQRNGERYCYSFESYYDEVLLSQMKSDSLAIVPLLVELPQGKKAVIMEGDLEDYPGMFLTIDKNNTNAIRGAFAPYPLEEKIGGHNDLNIIPTRRADYIARIKGESKLPWRAVVISAKDLELIDNDMAQKLASPSRIANTSWIRPGKVAWDWWNSSNITGVDFVTGMNTATYKYFIDFASANGIEYIIIDEGWSKGSLMNVIPEMNIPELVEYGKQKNVGVILWASWRLTDKEMEIAFPHYSAMGVKGFKVDFFDRDDQSIMQSVFAIAQTAAEYKLLLDLHGMKATGIQRTWPNVVTFEGVKGLENCKWAPFIDNFPKDNMLRYDVTIPYIRMIAGPLDYTPGAMKNATRETFRSINRHPMSQGTRVHQMAMYIIFESPLQMLADSPTAYMREQECTDFISLIPTVFDETIALSGEVGEYIAIARRKGDTWYVAAMTNWIEREIIIDLSFLDAGSYKAEIFRDGVNANIEATDYKKEIQTIAGGDKLTAKMYQGGGWTARITK